MTDARAAVGLDRLPWLTDEPKPLPPPSRVRARSGVRDLLAWAMAALLLVAGLSYWLGTRMVREPAAESSVQRPQETVKLPEVRESVQQQVPVNEAPEVVPAPEPAVSVRTIHRPGHRARPARATRRGTLSPMERRGAELAETVERQQGEKPTPVPAPPAVVRQQPLRLWPAQESQGARGRIVRIGAFGSREQAKLGWRRMQRVYPAVGRLPATVVTDRNSRGRVFYRFQIGTTSQAHSEVLCQRMEKMLRFSCAVVGLPGRAKVER